MMLGTKNKYGRLVHKPNLYRARWTFSSLFFFDSSSSRVDTIAGSSAMYDAQRDAALVPPRPSRSNSTCCSFATNAYRK